MVGSWSAMHRERVAQDAAQRDLICCPFESSSQFCSFGICSTAHIAIKLEKLVNKEEISESRET